MSLFYVLMRTNILLINNLCVKMQTLSKRSDRKVVVLEFELM